MSKFDPEALRAAAESHRQKTAMGSSATDQLAPNGSQVVEAERLLEISQQHVLRRYAEYEQLAGRPADMFSADARAKAAVTQDKEA